MVFSPNNAYLATANYGSNDVTVFSVKAGGVLGGGISYTLPSGSTKPYSVAFSPNGSYLAVADSGGVTSNVTIFNVGVGGILSGGTSYLLALSSFPVSVAFSSDGSYLAIANDGSNKVTVFSVNGRSFKWWHFICLAFWFGLSILRSIFTRWEILLLPMRLQMT